MLVRNVGTVRNIVLWFPDAEGRAGVPALSPRPMITG